MKNRFIMTAAAILLFASVATNGQAQKLTAMKDAGTLKYKGATYRVSVESIGKDTNGNTVVEIAGIDAKVPVTEVGNTEHTVAAISKYIMVKIVAGDQTYSAKSTVLKDGSVEMQIGGNGALSTSYVTPKKLAYTFETTSAPDRIIVYNDDVESVSFEVSGAAENKPSTAVQTYQQPAQQTQPAQQYQTYQQPAQQYEQPAQQTRPAARQYRQSRQPAQKQQTAVVADTKKDRTGDFKRWYVESGLSIYVLVPEYGDSEVYAGMALNGGFYSSPNSRFSLDMSFNFSSEDFGTFDYTKSGSSKVYTDGKVTRDYWIIPVQFTWNYVFNPSPVFKLRLGPSAGFTSLSRSYSFSPNVDNKPKMNSESTLTLSAGAGLGATWNIKQFFLDTGYKFLWNSETDMVTSTTAHHITFTFGWRF